jgi:hypothetical protein
MSTPQAANPHAEQASKVIRLLCPPDAVVEVRPAISHVMFGYNAEVQALTRAVGRFDCRREALYFTSGKGGGV